MMVRRKERKQLLFFLIGLLCVLHCFHGYRLVKIPRRVYNPINQQQLTSLADNSNNNNNNNDNKNNNNDENNGKNQNNNDNDKSNNEKGNSNDKNGGNDKDNDEDIFFADGKSFKDFHTDRNRVREYLGSPTLPIDPIKATVFPPKYIIDEIKERKSRYMNLRQPPEGWETMEPNDPRWIFAPLPVQGQADYRDAFSRHYRWKRRLGSLELSLWMNNALYGLLDVKDTFEFNLDDYVTQELLSIIEENAQKSLEVGDEQSFKNWAILSMQATENEKHEVMGVIRGYYDALSRRDRKAIENVWLPDPNSELMLPGHNKARGVHQRMEAYKILNIENKNFGVIRPKVLSLECFGNIAFVHTLDEVGISPRAISRATAQGQPEPKPLQQKRLFSTTVLRYANKQWRIMIHQTVRFRHSSFTNDLPEITVIPPKRAVVATPKSIPELLKSTTVNPSETGTSPLDELKKLRERKDIPGKYSVKFEDVMRPFLSSSTPSNSATSLAPASSSSSSTNSGKTSITPSSGTTKVSSTGYDYPTTGLYLYPDGISVTKKAIVTLRYLVDKQLLTKSEKDLLVNHMIDCISEDKKSNVETAFNVLFGNEPETLLKEAFERSIEEFCDQCHEILLKLKDLEQDLQNNKNADQLSKSISGIFRRNRKSRYSKSAEEEKKRKKSINNKKENEGEDSDEEDEDDDE